MSTATPQQIFDQAVQHHSAGRLRDAEMLYRQILAMDPNQPDALCGIALIAHQIGRRDNAIALWQRIVKAHREHAESWFWLSVAQAARGDWYVSASSARRACEAQPALPKAHAQLAAALSMIGKHDEAIASATRAAELAPGAAEIQHTMGRVLHRAGRFAEAEPALRRATEITPKVQEYQISLAAICDDLGMVDESIAAAEEAMRLGAPNAELLCNISTLERRRRRYRESVEYADRAIQLAPNHATAHGSRGLALLAQGDYAGGFAEYEWRWRCASFTTAPRDFARPMWDGSDPRGRTILVHSEQGFGDTIQFARYIPLLVDRGATVIVECNAAIRSLLQSLRGVARVVAAGLKLPDFDLHAPLMSLPRALGTSSIETIPADVPYLRQDDARIETFRSRISAANASAVKVGLVWWGNTKPDPNRSCPLPLLTPLTRVANVTFYSLQKGDVRPDANAQPPDGMKLVDLSKDLRDFADSAAAMMNLDLIITIDTAAAHLAGALGRPVWTMLPWAPDWRWMLDRDDSPWYPTMRLFRQAEKRDWPGVADRVARELESFAARSEQ